MLPMVELTIFALGILLIDLMIPRGAKWINAVTALVGVLFAAVCVWQIQAMSQIGARGFSRSLAVDPFAMYFWYLFLAGAAIAILGSVHYLDLEDENHGEYYALLLLSVVGMMCMAAGLDIVDGLTTEPSLRTYHLLPSVRGDLLEKLGRFREARGEFERAASLAQNARERTFLLERAATCARS